MDRRLVQLPHVSPAFEHGLQHSSIRYHKAETTEMQVADQGLVRETACAIVDKLKAGEVTPHDLLDALEKRIAAVNGPVNALPTLCFDRARDMPAALMKAAGGGAAGCRHAGRRSRT